MIRAGTKYLTVPSASGWVGRVTATIDGERVDILVGGDPVPDEDGRKVALANAVAFAQRLAETTGDTLAAPRRSWP